MATLLDGRRLAARIEQQLQAVVAAGLEAAGRPPGLAVLRVGDDPASGVYVANKEKACSRIGIRNLGAHLAAATPATEVQACINMNEFERWTIPYMIVGNNSTTHFYCSECDRAHHSRNKLSIRGQTAAAKA
jgi:hypothetical protein